MPTIEQLVRMFQLEPHSEGGFFRDTYRATESIARQALSTRFHGDRCHSTAIYFLIPKGKYSALHRIQADEVWHVYLGDPITVAQNKLSVVTLGLLYLPH